MTKRHPSERPSAARCLQLARGAVLDECFYSFAFGFFGRLRLMDQDAQAAELCDHFELLIRWAASERFPPPVRTSRRPGKRCGSVAA